MNQFVLLVNGPAYGSQYAYSALKFAEAAIQSGYKVTQVFFYQEGVNNASSLLCPASDEFAIAPRWQKLREHGTELVSCVSASLRRGIVDTEAAQDEELNVTNLASGFALGGLGEFVLASQKADRVIQFG